MAEFREERRGVKAWVRASLWEDRLMWVSERTPERNRPLFDSQLSDGPCGLTVQQQLHSHSARAVSVAGSAFKRGKSEKGNDGKKERGWFMCIDFFSIVFVTKQTDRDE